MAFEDFVEPEVAMTAAVTAAIFSPRARKIMRKGLVYSVAGVLTASDVVTSFAKSVSQGVQQASDAAVHSTQETINQAREMEKGAETTAEPEATTTPRRKAATKAEGAKSTEGVGGRSAGHRRRKEKPPHQRQNASNRSLPVLEDNSVD